MFLKNDCVFIHAETNQHPVTVRDIQNKHHNFVFGKFVDEQLVADLGYFVVQETPKPQDGFYREGIPVLIDGRYRQSWIKVEITEEENARIFEFKKTSLEGSLNSLLNSVLADGFSFNAGTVEKPSIQHVQIRDQDLAKLQLLKEKCSLAQAGEKVALRTRENEIVQLDAKLLAGVLKDSFNHYFTIFEKYWDIKEKIDLALNDSELPELPQTLV